VIWTLVSSRDLNTSINWFELGLDICGSGVEVKFTSSSMFLKMSSASVKVVGAKLPKMSSTELGSGYWPMPANKASFEAFLGLVDLDGW
jgi:hypothetical protein